MLVDRISRTNNSTDPAHRRHGRKLTLHLWSSTHRAFAAVSKAAFAPPGFTTRIEPERT
jgi:hypothetical protein